mmetsp:Transcript_4542/g.11234  ORF Transcript_4542/g.11234 Transcript_4542/m.11234 type:complete len:260 (-) Transcript_4542:1950-2729(-)
MSSSRSRSRSRSSPNSGQRQSTTTTTAAATAGDTRAVSRVRIPTTAASSTHTSAVDHCRACALAVRPETAAGHLTAGPAAAQTGAPATAQHWRRRSLGPPPHPHRTADRELCSAWRAWRCRSCWPQGPGWCRRLRSRSRRSWSWSWPRHEGQRHARWSWSWSRWQRHAGRWLIVWFAAGAGSFTATCSGRRRRAEAGHCSAPSPTSGGAARALCLVAVGLSAHLAPEFVWRGWLTAGGLCRIALRTARYQGGRPHQHRS